MSGQVGNDHLANGHPANGRRGRNVRRWTRARASEGIAPLLAGLLLTVAASGSARAQEEPAHSHGEADGAHEGLHFTHPLVTESISPDTKLRLDHQLFEFPDGDRENSGVLEGEYAFSRSFSIEAGIPYSYSATEFGNAEVLLKFANYAFEEAGVLLGYGVEFGFPTNGTPEAEPVEGLEALGPRFSMGGGGVEATLGTDEWEVAPFLNAGFKRGPVEVVAWGIFGIPFNHEEQEEVGTEISYNLSALYHVSSRVQALVELDGSGGISGAAVGEDVASLSPGIRVRLLPDSPLVLGSAIGFPLSDERPFDVRWKTSLFWHLPR